jgi:hypothetical protein
MNQTEATIEATLAAVGQKTTIGGASATGFAWLFSNEFMGLMGLLVAIAGLLVNVYFKRKEDARQQALHDAEMAALRSGHHE